MMPVPDPAILESCQDYSEVVWVDAGELNETSLAGWICLEDGRGRGVTRERSPVTLKTASTHGQNLWALTRLGRALAINVPQWVFWVRGDNFKPGCQISGRIKSSWETLKHYLELGLVYSSERSALYV